MRICQYELNENDICGAENPDDRKKCDKCGASLKHALHVLEPGARVQSYRIQRLIGHGGFGAVYQAEDTRQAGRVVALKETADPDDIRHFQQEYHLLVSHTHLHMPRYYDMFEDEDLENGYLVMEFVPGRSLGEVLVHEPHLLNETSVVFYANQLCDVLHYLHTLEPPLLHRDIKPDNVRLTNQRLIKLVDFGLVKQGKGKTKSSRRGFGTVAYAPLEQFGVTAGMHTDQRSDIYSLGATLYHLLTGQPPAAANVRMSYMQDPLTPPRDINPDVSPHVSDAIMQAMELRREQRFPDVQAMKLALFGVSADVAPPPPPVPQPAPVSLPVLAGTPVPFSGIVLSSDNLKRVKELARLGKGLIREIACSPDGTTLAVASRIGLTLYDTQRMTELRFISSDVSLNSVAWSTNGSRLVSGSDDHTVRVWDTAGGTLLHTLTGHTSSVQSVAWSTNGSCLVSGSDDKTVRCGCGTRRVVLCSTPLKATRIV